MKKNLFAFMAVIVIATSSHASIVTPVTEPTPVVAKLDATQLTTMSVKEFEQATGKKMNLAQKLAFKAAQKASKKATSSSGKSQLTAALLCFFLGGIGIHRFYLGYTWQGIVQVLTLGGLGIWSLIDFIRILTGSLQPKDSEYEKTL